MQKKKQDKTCKVTRKQVAAAFAKAEEEGKITTAVAGNKVTRDAIMHFGDF